MSSLSETTKEDGDQARLHPEKFNPPLDYSLRDLTIEQRIDYLVKRGIPEEGAKSAVELRHDNPEYLVRVRPAHVKNPRMEYYRLEAFCMEDLEED
jgi:hypothetical protein